VGKKRSDISCKKERKGAMLAAKVQAGRQGNPEASGEEQRSALTCHEARRLVVSQAAGVAGALLRGHSYPK
jgi:hypothetical protein